MEPPHSDEPETEPPRMATVAILFEGALILLALVLGWLFSVDPVETLRGGAAHLTTFGIAAMWGIAATAPMIAFLVLSDRFPIGPLRLLKSAVDDNVLPMFRDAELAELAMMSFLAGVGEEMLFRGFLQAGLVQWIGGEAGASPLTLGAAIGIASLIFGLCHAITRAYFAAATIISIYFGLLFVWTDCLLAPMIAHGLYDFLALVYLLHWRKGSKSAGGSD